ncbi:predicted protein [Nematostella vectensis]|uniref:Uncharacterized protein n=1 Tax=Nematostella vectensis TaxID=45351 RepID=A7RG23_NEMVE|nr:predicted protein [Nematostella vectensis]|eukprot:XP_001641762.1 predicted protein [Nematostella vectensis]
MSWGQDWEDPGNPLPHVGRNHYLTTYSSHHNYRALDELTPSRPTSPTRRNNPHPTGAFLHLRLREATGFPKPKVKPGQDPYRAGRRPEKMPIDIQRTMYYTLYEIKQLQKRGQDETLKALMNPKAIPVAQAWMSNASNKDKTAVNEMLQNTHNTVDLEKSVSTTFKPDIVPAVNRWLKHAGSEEQQAVMRLIRTLASDPSQELIDPKMTGQLDPNRYLLGKYDVSKTEIRDLSSEIKPDYRRQKTIFNRAPATFL